MPGVVNGVLLNLLAPSNKKGLVFQRKDPFTLMDLLSHIKTLLQTCVVCNFHVNVLDLLTKQDIWKWTNCLWEQANRLNTYEMVNHNFLLGFASIEGTD